MLNHEQIVEAIEQAKCHCRLLEFTLRYGEPGNGFAGETRFVAGVQVADEELAVKDVLAPEEMWF